MAPTLALSIGVLMIAAVVPAHVAGTIVTAGIMQAHYDDNTPFELRINPKGVAITGADAKYIHQEYTGIKLVGDDQATVLDLAAAGVTDKTAFSGSNDDMYYAVLGARVGRSSGGAKIFSAVSLARRALELTNVTFSSAAGAQRYCLATIDSAGNCVGKRTLKEGDFKFTIGAKSEGSNFAVPSGASYLRVTTKLTAVNMGSVDIYFNGDKAQTSVPPGQITSISFYASAVNRTIKWAIQQRYNRDNAVTGNMRIVGEAISGERAMNLHYDMPLTNITTVNQFLLYDPDVTVVAGDAGAGAGGGGSDSDSAASRAGTSGLAGAAIALAAAALALAARA